MSLIDAIMGKNMAISELQESGSVGYTKKGVILSGELTDGAYQDSTTKLEAGKEYTLKLDSGTYTATAISISTDGDGEFILFGNRALFGDDVDTGESYVVGYSAEEPLFIVADANNGKNFSLEGETIHPINKKYLPDMGGGLPHITLNATEIVVGETVEIADDDNNVLTELVNDMIANGVTLPLILTFSSGNKMTLVCAALESEENGAHVITYVGNLVSGGANIEVMFVALPPVGAVPTITVTVA